MNRLLIAPSILAADFGRLGEEMGAAEAAGADLHHIDVMDGHFVPNLSFGLALMDGIKRISQLPLDVHLMITNPDSMALEYVRAGADRLSFHIEASLHPHRLLRAIKEKGCKAGIAINPGTSLELLRPLLAELDFVNVMSVNPGFSGQTFITATFARLSELRSLSQSLNPKLEIEVDGGVNEQNASSLVTAGASILVVGNYFYRSKDRSHCIPRLRQSAS